MRTSQVLPISSWSGPGGPRHEGNSPDLDELFGRAGRSGRLGELHFPVGGKRFRPSLEEIVEFLVVEGLTEGRRGWAEAVEEYRAWSHRVELKGAVRRDPEAAREALAEVRERGILTPSSGPTPPPGPRRRAPHTPRPMAWLARRSWAAYRSLAHRQP